MNRLLGFFLRKVILNGITAIRGDFTEIEPVKSRTQKIDFLLLPKRSWVPFVCVTDIIKEGKRLFYKNEVVRKFTSSEFITESSLHELDLRKDLKLSSVFQRNLMLEWLDIQMVHSDFSKFILPYLQGRVFQSKTSCWVSCPKKFQLIWRTNVVEALIPSQQQGCFSMLTQESPIDKVKGKRSLYPSEKVHY